LLILVNSSEMALAPIVIPAIVKQTATIIFLHGLGDTGHGWSDEIAEIKPAHAKLICPTAPIKPVTINGGAKMPAWYDIKSLNKGAEDEEGIKESSEYIQSLIQKEVEAGIPSNQIVVGGFSQGAAISLYTGLTGRFPLAGVVAMSGYLPLFESIKWDSVLNPAILQCHGDRDPVVHYNIALTTKQRFEEQKFPNFTFKTYKGLDHSASQAEIKDVKTFFQTVLKNSQMRSELHGWSDEIAEIKPAHAKLICPTAPIKPVTINGGAKMPAWYDIKSLNKGAEDEEGIKESSEYIQSLIQKEVEAGIPSNQIVVGGFSQGAAISLYTGLTGRFPLAGVVAMSGYLPLFESIKWDSVLNPAILQCHGDRDPVVHYNIALTTKQRFEEQKFPNFTFKTYKGLDHSASQAEIKDVKTFFQTVLKNSQMRSEL
ncbi:unnamed protein product, partial [Allacma fusca]